MFTATQVKAILDALKAEGMSKADIIDIMSKYTIGWPYVFGAWGCQCTPGNRKTYADRCRAKHPDYADKIVNACPVLSGKQPNCDGCKWVDTLCDDCRGYTHLLLEWAGLQLYGDTVTTQWETSSNWVKKGDVSEMPSGLVCCVFRKGHTGMYVGDDLTRHCGGKKGQVMEEALPGNPKWLRYAIPAGLYSTEELRKAGVNVDESRNIPTLRRGSRGDDVEELQALLNAKYGANLEIDGIYGAKTEQAVKAFQAAHGLTADGVCGPKTRKALGLEYVDNSNPHADDPNNTLPNEPDDEGGVWLTMDEWRVLKAAVTNAMSVVKRHEGG